MSVRSITITFGPAKPRKPRPRIGDRKMIRGVLHERRQDIAEHFGTRCYVVSNGRPVCSWVPVERAP